MAKPKTLQDGQPGMSLRDWYAGLAMQGFHASGLHITTPFVETAKQAYEMADAMLAERGRK